jgi:serine/threonine-protein kinase ULK/ATG1
MSKVVENYIIMEEAGKGKYSTVHKGRHITTGEVVAVKIIKLDAISDNPEIQDMISEELQALRAVESPYIVKHLRYLRTTNNMYEVYEFYEGGDLSVLIQTEKCLPTHKALKLFKDLVKAIKVLYENSIIHRDIQPENIFLQQDRAVLGDFGNCK